MGLLDNIFGERGSEERLRMKIGLMGLTHNPNTALMQQWSNDLSTMQDERKEAAKTNRTLEWMRSQAAQYPQLVPLLGAMETGGIDTGAAVNAAFQIIQEANRPLPTVDPIAQEKAMLDLEKSRIEVDRLRNPPPAQPDPKAASDLRKEFSGQQVAKNFAVMSDSYGKIAAAAKDPSAAGDLALIFSFMKMLDPTSVVRETEFANAQNAAGVPERIRAMYNNVLSGQRLTASTRADFLKQADAQYGAAEKQYADLESQYRGLAERQSIAPQDVLLDYRYAGQRYTPSPTMGDLQGAGIGVSAAQGATTVVIDGQTYTIQEAE